MVKKSKSVKFVSTFLGILFLLGGLLAGIVLILQPQLFNQHAQVLTYGISITNNICSPTGSVTNCSTGGKWGQKYCTNGKWTDCVVGGFCTTAGNYSQCDCSTAIDKDKFSGDINGKCWKFCKPLLISNSSLNVTNKLNLGTMMDCIASLSPSYEVVNYSFFCRSNLECNQHYPNKYNYYTCLPISGLCARPINYQR